MFPHVARGAGGRYVGRRRFSLESLSVSDPVGTDFCVHVFEFAEVRWDRRILETNPREAGRVEEVGSQHFRKNPPPEMDRRMGHVGYSFSVSALSRPTLFACLRTAAGVVGSSGDGATGITGCLV